MPDRPLKNRSNNFIVYFQIEGVCMALRQLVPHGVEPGPQTRQLVRNLHDGLVEVSSGKPIEHIPEVTDNTGPADLLVIAETLRSTMLAFLTPEEVKERGALGFR